MRERVKDAVNRFWNKYLVHALKVYNESRAVSMVW